MHSLKGKVVVVTGSSRGIGFAIARACAAEGAAVVVSSRSSEASEAAAETLQQEGFAASSFACDVGEPSQVEALAARTLEIHGGFDVWVNNAGYAGYYGPTAHIAPSVFVRTVQTNMLGTYYGSMCALRHFLARSQGKLINLLGRGAREPVPMQNGYASSKAWVRNFTLALAEEYRQSGVGIYAYSPGMILTELVTDVVAVSGYETDLRRYPSVLQALARKPGAAGRKIAWLASSATDGKTGLELYETSALKALLAFTSAGFKRMLGHQEPSVEVTITSVPSVLPLSRRVKQGA